jgi:ubiquinone biosynthesis protein COQ4
MSCLFVRASTLKFTPTRTNLIERASAWVRQISYNLSPPLKLALCYSLASLETLRDPARADLLAILVELSSGHAVKRLYERVQISEDGKRMLSEQRRISNATLNAARGCSFGTFGQAYARFMDQRQFEPSERPIIRFSKNRPGDFVLVRLREIHDYLHVLFDCPTTVEGEVALKALEFVNCQLPISGLAALIGRVQLSEASRKRLNTTYFPWAIQAGLACTPLESIDFESCFHLQVQDVRQLYNIMPLPSHFKSF